MSAIVCLKAQQDDVKWLQWMPQFTKLFLPGNTSSFPGRFQRARTRLPVDPQRRQARRCLRCLCVLPFEQRMEKEEGYKETTAAHDKARKRLAGISAEITWRT